MPDSLDLKHWLHGLLATVINGCASAVVLVIADPADFNIWAGREKLLAVSLAMGLLGAANYLKNSPLPDRLWDGVTDRRQPTQRRDAHE